MTAFFSPRRTATVLASMALGCALVAAHAQTPDSTTPAPTSAAAAKAAAKAAEANDPCLTSGKLAPTIAAPPQPSDTPEQARIRQEITTVFNTPDLHDHQCVKSWQFKNQEAQKPSEPSPDAPKIRQILNAIAAILKALLVIAAICAVVWLVMRYRNTFMGWVRRPSLASSSEVSELDLRPETLPDDVTAAVLQLWQQQQHRAALALLYRATLSRFMQHHNVTIAPGTTEGDCLRLALQPLLQQRSPTTCTLLHDTSAAWQQGAYGQQWPQTDTLTALCARWREHLDRRASTVTEHRT